MPSITTHLVESNLLESISSFVAENTRVRGDLEALNDEDLGIKVDGVVEGSIKIPNGGTVYVGPTGRVEGEVIEADYVYVEGLVVGGIVARKGVELSPSSTIKGSIQYYGAMNMHNLAKVKGTVQFMGD
jgi:cytoskeletal protein CcmA (bactofilin family)